MPSPEPTTELKNNNKIVIISLLVNTHKGVEDDSQEAFEEC